MTTDLDLDKPWKLVLEKAKTLSGFCPDDESVLQESAQAILPHSQEIISSFYDTLFSHEDSAAIFEYLNQDQVKNEKIFHQWLELLMQGKYDDQFWRWQWLVGLAHVQHNVGPVYVLSMFVKLQSELVKIIFSLFDTDSAERLILAYTRVIGCLTTLAVEAYHCEFVSAVATTGLEGTVLERLVSIEVKKKIKNYRKLLPAHPHQLPK